MNDRRSHARTWIAKAESDLMAAERLLAAEGPYDAVCFHAQQACEKALKALLALREVDIPRTHNLEELQARCRTAFPEALPSELSTADLAVLTPYAVEARYDAEFWPDREAGAGAVSTARQLVHAVSNIARRDAGDGPD